MKEKIHEVFSLKDPNKQAEIIENLIEGLPESGKKNEFLERLDNAGDQELSGLLGDVEKFYKLRDQALNDTEVNEIGEAELFFDNNFSNEQKQKTKVKIWQVVKEAMDNKLECIGEGKTAKVFTSKFCPEYCYKIVTDFDEYKRGKNVREEAEFLDELADLELEGCRTPKPFYYIMNKDFHILVMETIDGDSLEDFENKKAKLPAGFNLELFIRKLNAYIEKMHKQKGVHHRDLHPGNIMLTEGGEIRIIDFGKAKFSFSSNEKMIYNDTNGYNEPIRYTPDLEKIKDIKMLLTKLIAGEKNAD